MKDIFEIRFHGRGGQGAKTASQFVAEAAMDKGKNIQAFPEYGPERAGAPMRAFVRISDREIRTYAPVVSPDIVIVIDPTLVNEAVVQGLPKEGVLLVNTHEEPAAMREATGFAGKICTVDATKIALETVGKNLPNTPMLGALLRVKEIIGLDALNNKVRQKFEKKIGEQKTQATIDAIKHAYDSVRIG